MGACLRVSCGIVQKLVGAGGAPNPPEDCKPLWRGAAPARKAASRPRIPALPVLVTARPLRP